MGFRHILGLSFTFWSRKYQSYMLLSPLSALLCISPSLTGISFSSAIHVSGKQVRGVLKTCRGVLMIGAAFG